MSKKSGAFVPNQGGLGSAGPAVHFQQKPQVGAMVILSGNKSVDLSDDVKKPTSLPVYWGPNVERIAGLNDADL